MSAMQRTGLFAWTGLLLVQVLWYTVYPPVSIPTWVAFALTVPPLLLPLLSLPNVARALLWVGILALFYFCHGVSEAWSSTGDRWLAFIEIALTLLLIGSLGAGVRRRR
ncbi:putative membrane protein [Lutibacter sp. SG786]|nr:putative membrane protein [Luteibacter sp. SG786]